MSWRCCRSRRLCGTLLPVALALLFAPPLQAEDQGSLRLPESLPPMLKQEAPKLIDPPPASDSWATPGLRPLGVTLNTYSVTEEQIAAAAGTGCGIVRLPIPMEKFIEGAEPDWSTLDQVISRLRRAGFEIMPVLNADSAVPEFYRAFAKAIAQRYGPTFKYYQILDNVNYKIGLDSQSYADLLSSIRTTIILADADAVIVSGGIRGADLTYVELLERQGAMRSIDILAFNLFPPPDGIESRGHRVRAEHSLPYMQDAVALARSYGKRVWVTSLGISTDYSWVGVDQPTQASLLTRSPLFLGWIGVERIMFSAIQDSDPTYLSPPLCCGVLDVDGNPKASYHALFGLNQAVSGAYHVVPPFQFEGSAFQQPNTADIANLFMSEEARDLPEADVMANYQIYGLPVYCFWFYAPATHEYRLVYWLGADQPYATLMSLVVTAPGLKPLIKHLRPIDSFQMLDNAPAVISNPIHAENLVVLPYVKLDTIPGVIRFDASGAGNAT